MHRYRDALLFTAEPLKDPVQGVAKAWFVYPGDSTGLPRDPRKEGASAPVDSRERLWRAVFTLGVGAIPALPGKSKLLRTALRYLIDSTPGALERERPRTVHAGQLRLPETGRCLWAVVPDERRLGVHARAKLYHMPADRIESPESVDFLLLGVRAKDGDQRSVVYPSFVYRVEYARSCGRSELPRDYRRALGVSSFQNVPPTYHLFRLRDQIALDATLGSKLSAEAEDLFVVRTVRETLARLGSA